MILIFIALSDYEISSTVKIFRIYGKSYSLLLILGLNKGEGLIHTMCYLARCVQEQYIYAATSKAR